MPETPDLDTLDLPGLLALWAERYPGEISLVFVLHNADPAYARFRVPDSEDGYVVDVVVGESRQQRSDEAYDLHLIEGHARACIEQAGWMVNTYSGDDGKAERPASYHAAARPPLCRVPIGAAPELCEGGPSLAVALVRLRLSLPQPTDR